MDLTRVRSERVTAEKTFKDVAITAGTKATRVAESPSPRMGQTRSQRMTQEGAHRLQDIADKASQVMAKTAMRTARVTQRIERKAVKSAEETAIFCGLTQLLLVLTLERAHETIRRLSTRAARSSVTPSSI